MTHGWSISGNSDTVSILKTEQFEIHEDKIGVFTFRLVDTDPLISSMSVEASIEINGTVVTCVDALESPEAMIDMQKAYIEVLGKPNNSIKLIVSVIQLFMT